MKLIGKIVIKGQIKAVTGLHIGGNAGTKRIGELDNPVIKDGTGKPYIPGSSLKGKLRSMLAKTEGSVCITKKEFESTKDKPYNASYDENFQYILDLFGSSGDNEKGNPARLLVRDASLIEKSIEQTDFLDSVWTQYKWENRIDRLKGSAKDPRQQERVPAGARFSYELVLDCYDQDSTALYLKKIFTAMELLEKDYIGGSGSRGYGQIKFFKKNLSFTYYKIDQDGLTPTEEETFTTICNTFKNKDSKNENSNPES